ncbi:Rtr1/RPAP2 family-domain-containing protein [Aspergillus taichungensis]|uniref:RNA polymerase II subunit B1 CTD phosphatase RPAP2 homolog n=1 Tax=Aspergillus taichungensis TaxID=482145 RepID=A0A2J5HVQ4_9EURO|nr:Rtr1/RPAP2 family-domain-containing protein [Aspergillus taichungensis]
MSSHKPPVRNSLPATHAASTASAPKPKPNASRAPAKHTTTTTTSQGPNQHSSSSDPRHLAIALHHAHRIQHQKDTEALILDRILDLITLPSSPTADPANPSATDAHALKSALIPFQPSDYDNLIQERNIEGHCGYPLCPRPHRSENAGPNGSYRITWGAKGSGPGGRGRSMNIVPRESLEKWCSDECAERALYIRVQLAAEPVWERRAADVAGGQEILLLEEGRAAREGRADGKGKARCTGEQPSVRNVTGQMENLSMDVDSAGREPGDVAGEMARLSVRDGDRARALAMERGDAVEGTWGDGRVGVRVRENDLGAAAAVAPRMRPGDERGGSIEGYVPAP